MANSLKLLPTTLCGPLWQREPQPKPNGLLIEGEMGGGNFSSVAFAMQDPMRFCIGDTNGAIFHFNLKKNKYLVVVRLNNGPVRSISWVNKDHILAANGMVLALVNTDSAKTISKVKGGHNNNISRVGTAPGAPNVAFSMSSDSLVLWQALPLTLMKVARASSQFIDAVATNEAIYTIESGSVVSKWSVRDLSLLERVDVSPHKLSSVAAYDTFLVVGLKSKSAVLCLDSNLGAISCVNIPGTSPVRAVRVLGGALFAAQGNDGMTWFVNSSDYSVAFSMSHPCPNPPVAFDTGDATYAFIATASRMFLYHLPTAKNNFDRLLSINVRNESSLDAAVPFVQKPTDRVNVPADAAENSSVAIPKSVLSCPDPEDSSRPWVKVNLIGEGENKQGRGISKPIPVTTAVRELHANLNPAEAAKRKAEEDAKKKKPALSSLAAGRKKKDKAAPPDVSVDDHAGEITMRALLDHDSRIVNMDKLRSLLMRYGVFPERYRHLIWRFLLHLPEKRTAAPHYANLVSKGMHPSTPILLKPFPLPDNRLRLVFQRTLSALAWHAPSFQAAHFMPSIVFPFVKVFGADVQSSIEVVIAFFMNWGQEFFQYYPHPPVSIISFVSHTLKAEDEALWNHLNENSVGTDAWCWMQLSSLYTDVVTRNEWLQVFDHVFANEPLWLYLFHVRWLVHIRTPLLQLNDHTAIVALLQRCTPININSIIQQTYRLHNRVIRSELTEPYEKLLTYDDSGYPLIADVNEAIITSKVQEIQKIAAHEQEVVSTQNRISEVKTQLAKAAMLEDAFVGKQRALVAAKFEAENETWVQRVQMEKERQRLRDLEHETRLQAIQEQLHSAHRLEGLQQEMTAANASAKDAQTDRDRETMKWDFADRMAQHEVDRLESGARMKLAMMMTSAGVQLPGDAQQAATLHAPEAPHELQPESVATVSVSEPIQTPSEVTGITAASQQTPHPPPPIPPASREELPPRAPSALRQPQASEAVQTELPPPAPAATLPPQQRSGSSTPTTSSGRGDIGTGSTSTTVPSSSCDEDPVAYYRNLQSKIQRDVAKAQRDQQEALAQLRSRYARRLVDEDDGSSTVTEPVADDDDDTQDDVLRRQQHHQHHQQYDEANTTTASSALYGDDTTIGEESVNSSSMTRVLLQPHRDAHNMFSLRPQGGATTSTTSGSS